MTTQSQASIEVPPATVPQLPPAIARHPLVLLVAAVATIIGSIAAINPGSDAAAVKANAAKLDAVQADQAEIKLNLVRFTDRFGDRVDALEKRMDKLDRYHDSVDRHWTDMVPWQDKILRRLDKLEK